MFLHLSGGLRQVLQFFSKFCCQCSFDWLLKGSGGKNKKLKSSLDDLELLYCQPGLPMCPPGYYFFLAGFVVGPEL